MNLFIINSIRKYIILFSYFLIFADTHKLTHSMLLCCFCLWYSLSSLDWASFESPISVPFFNGLALYNQSRSETQLLRYCCFYFYPHSPLLFLLFNLFRLHDTLHVPLRTWTTLLNAMARPSFPLALCFSFIFVALPLSLATTDPSDGNILLLLFFLRFFLLEWSFCGWLMWSVLNDLICMVLR